MRSDATMTMTRAHFADASRHSPPRLHRTLGAGSRRVPPRVAGLAAAVLAAEAKPTGGREEALGASGRLETRKG